MKVLVTGANSLLASNTILELVNAGIPVRGFIRDPSKFLLPPNHLIDLVSGDLADLAAVEVATEGCTHVIHIAALTEQDEYDYSKYRKVNVHGTRHVLMAARKHRVQRIVFVSTANTLGYGTLVEPGNEQHPMKEPFTNSLYALSKKEAEDVVKKFSNELDVVTVHPTFMLGAYDARPSSGKIITMVYNKRLIFYPPGGKSFVHVQDVAFGIINALTKGRRGDRYLLANENLSYKEFFLKVSKWFTRNPVLIPIPSWILLPLGYFGNLLRLTGMRTSLSLTNMKILCITSYHDNTKATQDLDVIFQSTDCAIEASVTWYKEKGIL